ncbi:MAG: hypothetical protein QXS91_01220 [Candidatus Anstonellales archaeon]
MSELKLKNDNFKRGVFYSRLARKIETLIEEGRLNKGDEERALKLLKECWSKAHEYIDKFCEEKVKK